MKFEKLSFKKLSWGAALVGVTLLVGCNLYNPNGAEESSCDAGNADCYIALGQSLVQQKSFEASMNAYAKAIAIDSSKSEAYWGYATAATFQYHLEMGPLLDDMDSASHGNASAFINHDDDLLTERLQMSAAVVSVLGRLADRDSLTRWYAYLTDSTKKNSDPDFAKRKAFITAYLAANTTGSRSANHFPLTDRKKKFEDNVFQYAPHLLLYTILHTYDLDGNNIFNNKDRAMRNLLSTIQGNTSGGGLISLGDSMETDPVLKQQVNDKILELQAGLGDLSSVLAAFNITPNSDTGSASVQSKKQLDSTISSLGGSLVFYQFGDKIDNDGDGCIDEELVDSLDNDLDGFYDEDARVNKGTGSSTSPGDSVNNDKKGAVDDIAENLLGGLSALENGSRPYWLGYVYQYMKDNHEIGTDVSQTEKTNTWVKIKKGDANMDARIAIQADSLGLPSRASRPDYQAKLQNAKTLVGGCWRNY